MDPAPRSVLEDLFSAAVRAADPAAAVRQALDRLETPSAPVAIIAIGKAAVPMAGAAVQWLKARSREPVGGIVIAPEKTSSPHPILPVYPGEHPQPGPQSFAAAEALGEFVARRPAEAEVWVLLSGGASSLAAAPVPGVTPGELTALFSILLSSGLSITATNAVRKRFARWGAGRLAEALAPAPVRVFAISDVPADDFASIGSGPCAPDEFSAPQLRAELETSGLWDALPSSLRRHLAAVAAGRVPETPKPGGDAFARVQEIIIARNLHAREGAAIRAMELGQRVQVMLASIEGEAAATGRALGNYLLDAARVNTNRIRCFIWGGETTVRLSAQAGTGGRCQELALAAAQRFDAEAVGQHVTLIAAGTDGRDGPTDAAGAVVDGSTWGRIQRAGRDSARDLKTHHSYEALDAAGALLRTGLTGTNVMDMVIGVVDVGRWVGRM